MGSVVLTSTQLDRLIMLVTIADYDGDGELKRTLATMRTRTRAMEFVNTFAAAKECTKKGWCPIHRRMH